MSTYRFFRVGGDLTRFKWEYNGIFHKEKSIVEGDFYTIFNPESHNPIINYIPLFPHLSMKYCAYFKNTNILLKPNLW